MKNIAIILSGGVGSRMGSTIPKQYLNVNGKPIIVYSINKFLQNDNIDSVVLCVASEWEHFIIENLEKEIIGKPIKFSKPGNTRQMTIFNALVNIRKWGTEDSDIVIIHDAARPLVSNELINNCIKGCNGYDGVMPVVHVKDTIYQSDDGRNISNLLNRNLLYAGQAPESFVFGKYLKAHESMDIDELLCINGSTEIAYKSGLDIHLICGDEKNFKITTSEDLLNFENLISHESE